MSDRDFELEFSRLQDIADVAFEQSRERAEAEETPCEHEDLEVWFDPYGRPRIGGYDCREYGPSLLRVCVACGAVEQPDGTFSL